MEDKQLTSKENIRRLVDGELPLEMIHELVRMPSKDEDRFWKYLEVLQEKVDWPERILARISDHLYVVSKDEGERVVKCDCGQEFGDYRVNWKLNALVHCRRTEEQFREVFTVVRPDPDYVEVREYYCPGCQAQLGVEVVPIGYPPLFEVLPDVDAVHELGGRPLADADPSWFEDRTASHTERWARKEEE